MTKKRINNEISLLEATRKIFIFVFKKQMNIFGPAFF